MNTGVFMPSLGVLCGQQGLGKNGRTQEGRARTPDRAGRGGPYGAGPQHTTPNARDGGITSYRNRVKGDEKGSSERRFLLTDIRGTAALAAHGAGATVEVAW